MNCLFLLVIVSSVRTESVFYHSYTGNVLTETEVKEHIKKNNTFWCVDELLSCDPLEGRRVDGTCNNLKHPSVGSPHTPAYRLLPADYGKDFEPRRSKSGEPLPLSRSVRTGVLAEGRIPDTKFTQLLAHFWLHSVTDVVSQHDTVNYILWKPHCCDWKGNKDRECTPNFIPDDDPVHKFSTIRCMNLTRPISFQLMGCAKNNTAPDTIVTATPHFDLSQFYGNSLKRLNNARLFEKGLLKTEVENEKIWPLSLKTKEKICLANKSPRETRCHDTRGPIARRSGPDNGILEKSWEILEFYRHTYSDFSFFHSTLVICSRKVAFDEVELLMKTRNGHHDYVVLTDIAVNAVFGSNVFGIWTWRLHNRIATVLSALNPCWDDDKTFFTTRDIVIAFSMQIYYYELMPAVMGYENLVREGVITPHEGFRDLYDENILPQISSEFPFVQRWAHTIQEGKLKMYDAKGDYLKDNDIVNMTLRTGYLVDNLEYATQGAFRQPGASFDYSVDPDIAETGLGGLQAASDILASDLSKNRYLGFPPYIQYRKLCSRKTYKKFEDLFDVIDPERIELLKQKYKHVEDIDLLAGIWLEKPVNGGYVPVTLYCIVVEQLLRSVISDRHWYERPNRPKAFKLEQLLEVRKASIAQFLCAVGDTVTEIQPQAFFLPGKGNEIRSCSEIQKLNLEPWRDVRCDIKEPNTLDCEI